jgi:hypothetical protein
MVISLRRAVASAPASDPTLITENSTVKAVSEVLALACGRKVCLTSSGMTTWKLKARVPIRAIIISGMKRSGTERA